MKYEKAEIVLVANAAQVIQGPKSVGPKDTQQPGNPIHTPAAYESDE
jgi:hypothetical protein